MADIQKQIATLINGMNLSDEQINQLAENLNTLKSLFVLETDEAVAKAKDGSHLTRKGFDLLGRAVAGQELKYTRIAFGDSTSDGVILEPTLEEQFEFNALINWKMDIPLAEVRFTGGGTAAVKGVLKNTTIETGFFMREMGLFAIDPETNQEILYAYRNSILCDYLPGSGGAILWDLIFTMITVIDSATNVTAVIDSALAYVSQVEFSQHIYSNNPHPNIPTKGADVEKTSAIWSIDEDDNLHKISADNLAKQLLGGEASTIPKLNSRLTQAEVNIANLFMQLDAEKELGLQANLLLVEDFSDNESCDMYSCKVLTALAGIDNIQLQSDQNILCGSWYTISDGVNSEYVQVQSVNKNGSAYVVVVDRPLTCTYNLDNCYFMRSTSTIAQNSAQGAGDIRAVTQKFTETFSGAGANVLSELPLNTTQSKAAAFALTGDFAFVDGFFTLT